VHHLHSHCLHTYTHPGGSPFTTGARFLMETQAASGDWPQQQISGVFNRNCMITYANYR